MIQIFKNEDCCGCNACGDICPTDAITFPSDKEGFWYPKVDLDKCIDCHLCEKVCPMLHKHVREEVYDEPKVIGAYNKDESIRLDSTSGGVHAALMMTIPFHKLLQTIAISCPIYEVPNTYKVMQKEFSRPLKCY